MARSRAQPANAAKLRPGTRRSLRLSRHALLWAILLSLLLHALLLGGFHLPNLRGNLLQPSPLEARLQLLP
ncbi:MAG: hypothetical protein M0T86_01935, partial [Betaproteobacteria bacterium]|nr:hypothetical protein [Betaproteobacteria bacterium]